MTTLGLGRHEAAQILEQRMGAGGGMGNGGSGFLHGITNNRLAVALAVTVLLGAVTWFTTVSDAREKVKVHGETLTDHEKRIRKAEDQLLVDGEWKRSTGETLRQILDEVKGKERRR